ncbi:MAG TPA: ATP-binding protein, partial [Actinobacteria bacterium]|nr:ATP-binding protein [Actinomycetota bacterium]
MIRPPASVSMISKWGSFSFMGDQNDSRKWLVDEKNLRWTCDPNQFKFESTEELEPLAGVVGQDRAVSSIDFGFKNKAKGYNIYAAGPIGTGKHSAITSYINEFATGEDAPSDWCYVYNFRDPDRPIAIQMNNGRAPDFARDMDELIDACRTEIPQAFDSEEYERQKDNVLNHFQSRRDAHMEELKQTAAARRFSVELTTTGIVTVPIVDGKLMKKEEYERLPENEKTKIKKKTEELQSEVSHVMSDIRSGEKETKRKLQELDKQITSFAVGHLLDDLKTKYASSDKIKQYLEGVQENIVENVESFRETEHHPEMRLPGMEIEDKESPWEKYKVNILVSTKTEGAPVIFEPNPTYYNLFGRLEYSAKLGAMVTNFTMIKPGAIHKANGGYLILNALDLLVNFLSYDTLKRVLKTRESHIENIGDQFRIIPVATLNPEPVPVDVKVVLIGNRYIYNLLLQLDEDFRKLFKVKADFQIDMSRSLDHTEKYASLVSARCRQENLKHFDPSGVAKIVEYGTRLAEDKEKLSTRFLDIMDLISEASFWASETGNSHVTAADVSKAIEERVYRFNMIEEKIRELITDGTIMIDTDGEIVGQVNGIAIIALGDYMFGKPSRITSKVYVGKKGVINIERESKMSGQIYNKAVMILTGYLAGNFAQDKPLAISASIGFEQSYEMIEGDSASSAELYALLSSLSGVPIKQGIAVTGSVNQQGEVQPIGGANHKIEGYYDVCKARGLTGDQGVLIPGKNVRHLMLREDIIEAVRDGKWHIWAVDHIDEGLQVLTGRPAGKRLPDGSW